MLGGNNDNFVLFGAYGLKGQPSGQWEAIQRQIFNQTVALRHWQPFANPPKNWPEIRKSVPGAAPATGARTLGMSVVSITDSDRQTLRASCNCGATDATLSRMPAYA